MSDSNWLVSFGEPTNIAKYIHLILERLKVIIIKRTR
jgi:hypothetical protein